MMNNFFHIIDYLRELFAIRLQIVPASIKYSLFLIIFCVVAIIELCLFISIRRRIINSREEREKRWGTKFSNLLANIIVYGENETTEAIVEHFLPRFERLPVYRKPVRKALVKAILSYHANLTGNSSDVLRELYLRLKLDQYAKKHISSRYPGKQINAIKELSQLQVPGVDPYIGRYLSVKNDEVRLTAQSAYMALNKISPFSYFDTAAHPFSDWEQAVLFESITKNGLSISSFATWLKSENDTVVLICLKLIVHYQQLDAVPPVIGALKHKNTEIRVAAVCALGKLEVQAAEATLIAMYFDEVFEVRSAIVDALGKIASGDHLDFLKARAHASETELRFRAIRSIRAHSRKGREMLTHMLMDANIPDKLLIKQFLDERIT